MEILKYYDDDTIEEEAVFFSNKKIIFFTIVLLLLAIFSWLSLDLVKELTSKLIIVLYACFVVINSVLFLICMTIIILRCEANEEYYSKHELTGAKEKYEHKRKKF